jgi:hypothetical protein
MGIWGGRGRWGRKASDGMRDIDVHRQGGEGLGKAVVVKVAEVQHMAMHGQTCTKDRTGSVALRAAIESAVQLGRNEADMANPAHAALELQLNEHCSTSITHQALPHPLSSRFVYGFGLVVM